MGLASRQKSPIWLTLFLVGYLASTLLSRPGEMFCVDSSRRTRAVIPPTTRKSLDDNQKPAIIEQPSIVSRSSALPPSSSSAHYLDITPVASATAFHHMNLFATWRRLAESAMGAGGGTGQAVRRETAAKAEAGLVTASGSAAAIAAGKA